MMLRCLPLWLLLLLTSGCSVSRTSAVLDGLAAKDSEAKLAAVADAEKADTRKVVPRLVEVFINDEATREPVASMVIIKGRQWFNDHRGGPANYNAAIVELGTVVKRQDLEPWVRAKAVWMLAEIGDRRARPYIEGAYAGDSKAVGEEVGISLDKLGFTERGHGFECLADGYTVAAYDPVARGHCPALEEATP